MDIVNILLLLAEIGSEIGKPRVKGFNIDLKSFRKTHNLSFLNKLPVFDEGKNYIFVKGNTLKVGTIIKRPLNFPIISSTKIEFHYGVVIGTSIDGIEYIIEMTQSGVKLTSKSDFLVNKFCEEQIEVESLPALEISRETILNRASYFQFESFNWFDLNCKVFAENIVFNIPQPNRILNLRKFQLELCDFKKAIYSLQLSEPENQKYRNFLVKQIQKSEEDKKLINSEIEKLEKNRLK